MFFYIVVFLLISFFAYSFAKSWVASKQSVGYLLAFLLITCFMGFRYNIGRDFPGYWGDFNILDETYFGLARRYQFEYGYLFLLNCLHFWGLGPRSLFFSTSLIITCLLFRIYKKNKELLPLGILCFLFCDPYEFSINGIRQAIAILAVINAFEYFKPTYRWWHALLCYLLWIILGSLFHSSCIALLAAYPLRFINWERKPLPFILSILPLIGYVLNLSGLVVGLVDFSSFEVDESVRYGQELEDNYGNFAVGSNGLNLGTLLVLIFMMFPLAFKKNILRFYPNLNYLFPLYSIGTTVFFLYSGNMMINRLAYYFTFTLLLLFPALVKSWIKSKKSNYQVFLLGFFGWYLVRFMYTMLFDPGRILWPGAALFGITFY